MEDEREGFRIISGAKMNQPDIFLSNALWLFKIYQPVVQAKNGEEYVLGKHRVSISLLHRNT